MPSPSPEWMDRTLRAPVAEHLTQEEFRNLFKLSEDVYDRYRASGAIPEPKTITSRTILHPWEHAVFFALWLRFGSESKEGVKGKEAKL